MNDNLNSYFPQDGIKINGQYQKNKGNNQNNNIQAMQSTRAQSR